MALGLVKTQKILPCFFFCAGKRSALLYNFQPRIPSGQMGKILEFYWLDFLTGGSYFIKQKGSHVPCINLLKYKKIRIKIQLLNPQSIE